MAQRGLKPEQLKRVSSPALVAKERSRLIAAIKDLTVKLDADTGVNDTDYTATIAVPLEKVD